MVYDTMLSHIQNHKPREEYYETTKHPPFRADELFTFSQSGGWALELQGFFLFCGLAVLFLGSGKIAVKPD